MSDDEKEDKPVEEKPSASGSSKPDESLKDRLPNLYSRFVQSFENALSSVTGDGKPSPRSRLHETTLEGIAEFIKKERPQNVIVMTGAGISTSCGIPDFRSPGSGLYDNLAKFELPDPQAIFDIGFFRSKPEPFFTLCRDLLPENIKPSTCHYFIRLMEKKGILRRWYTQNIDALEYAAGMPEEKVVAAHGSHRTSTCLSCSKTFDHNWLKERLSDKDVAVPRCDKCEGIVKPDIVFFGETLPKRFFHCTISDFPKCDLLLIFGTSLVVQPFAGLVHEVAGDVPRLLVNLEECGRVGLAERALGIQGLCYGHPNNHRDVFFQGTCDEGARRLAQLLDWERDLDILIRDGSQSKV